MFVLRDQPIRRKLMSIAMLTAGSALLLTCVAVVAYDLVTFRTSMERELSTLAGVVSASTAAPLLFNDVDAMDETLRMLEAAPDIVNAGVYGTSGALFSGYRRQPVAGLLPAEKPQTGFYFDGTHLCLVQAVEHAGNEVGSLYLQADLTAWHARALRYTGIVAVILVLALGGAFVLASRLQRTISRPIQHLADTSRLVADEGDYSVRATVQSYDELGQLTRTFNSMLDDIEQRERELVEAKDQAEEMVRLKTSFLNNITHEIRTPLTGIIGYAQVLAEEVPEAHREFVCVIESSGQRLLETLNGVLDLARLEADEFTPVLEEVDLAAEADEVVKLLSPLVRHKDVTVCVVTEGFQEVTLLDRTAVNRILNNLVRNAIKFTEEGEVVVRVEQDDARARLVVEDTGIGISPEFMPHLFDEFRQQSQGLDRSHEGSGLGLAITQRLVSLMGGTIEVDSTEGVGTTFAITFVRRRVVESAVA